MKMLQKLRQKCTILALMVMTIAAFVPALLTLPVSAATVDITCTISAFNTRKCSEATYYATVADKCDTLSKDYAPGWEHSTIALNSCDFYSKCITNTSFIPTCPKFLAARAVLLTQLAASFGAGAAGSGCSKSNAYACVTRQTCVASLGTWKSGGPDGGTCTPSSLGQNGVNCTGGTVYDPASGQCKTDPTTVNASPSPIASPSPGAGGANGGGTTCGSANIASCTSQPDCVGAGGTWTSAKKCASTCGIEAISACTNQKDCQTNGGTWTETTKVCDNSDPAQTNGNCSNISSCDLVSKYLNPFIAFLAALVGIAVAISIVIGGIQYGSSAGDPQKASAAKNRIRNAIIALVAFLFLYALLNFLIPGGLFHK